MSNTFNFQGDKIYMLGFSRGAFTAKFLARMIHTVGLLCKGNEEMVPFAYRLYQRYLAGDIQEFTRPAGNKRRNGKHPDSITPLLDTTNHVHQEEHEHEVHPGLDEITAFSNTFCRKERTLHAGHVDERNIKVYFLGMFDCVNSVAVLERKSAKPVQVSGTATYVRHAVSVDERRVKFKAALLAQDIRASAAQHDTEEDIKEVWFPGCHGDIGGGWPAIKTSSLDGASIGAGTGNGTGTVGGGEEKMSLWQRLKNFWSPPKVEKASKYLDSGPFQMSDIPLAWMIREMELVGEKDASAAVKWRGELLDRFKRRFKRKKSQALGGVIHDSLRFGGGAGVFTVLLWKFLGKSSGVSTVVDKDGDANRDTEWWPFSTRWELEGDTWVNIRFPLNKGATRDIPPDAVLHESLLWRLNNDSTYHPQNNHGGRSAPCLKHLGKVAMFEHASGVKESDSDHQTYCFSKRNTTG